MSNYVGNASSGEVADAIEESVHQLSSEDSFEGFEAVSEMFGEADIIGIGERSHGAQECFQGRHNLAQYLIENDNIRTLCVEMNIAAAARLDEYIRHGEGTPEEVLDSDGVHPHWHSETALEFAKWLREFNANRDPADQVRVYGLDCKSGRPLARDIVAFLRKVDPEFLEEVKPELEYFTEKRVDTYGSLYHRDEVDPDEYLKNWQELGPTLEARFEEHAEKFIKESSVEEYERVKHSIDMFEYTAETIVSRWNRDVQDMYATRAKFLADTCEWVYERDNVDRVLVTAHNLHVRQGGLPEEAFGCEILSMFDRLSEQTDADLASVGFEVGGGTFRVIDSSPDNRWEYVDLQDLSELAFPTVLSEVSGQTAVVDINEAAEHPTVEEWFDNEPELYGLATISEPSPVQGISSDPRVFNLVIFSNEVNPYVDFREE